jgi:ArsR family transcriptional regulator, arsenate/arsenite/antimonite-responsive transcriptional repressor
MREFLAITNALADESRVRVLLALRCRELCVCQITEMLGLATSTVSKHLSILRQAGLVEVRKSGRWIHCRLADGESSAMAREAMQWAHRSLQHDARFKDDQRELMAILQEDPEDVCRRQMGRSPRVVTARATRVAAR